MKNNYTVINELQVNLQKRCETEIIPQDETQNYFWG